MGHLGAEELQEGKRRCPEKKEGVCLTAQETFCGERGLETSTWLECALSNCSLAGLPRWEQPLRELPENGKIRLTTFTPPR